MQRAWIQGRGKVFHGCNLSFPGGAVARHPPAHAEDKDSVPWQGRSPGGGNGNPLQYSCLEYSMERSLGGYSPWGCKAADTTQPLGVHAFGHKSDCQIQRLFQYRWPLLVSMETAQAMSIIKDGFEATIATQLERYCCCCSCLLVPREMF